MTVGQQPAESRAPARQRGTDCLSKSSAAFHLLGGAKVLHLQPGAYAPVGETLVRVLQTHYPAQLLVLDALANWLNSRISPQTVAARHIRQPVRFPEFFESLTACLGSDHIFRFQRFDVSNSLTGLLELATREPGYGPEFYRCLLDSEVYALLPAEGNGLDEGKARFVMWNDATGARVIPFFSSRAAVRRVLTKALIAFRLKGREFLELTRGATIVLDPNEPASCRLNPHEVMALLGTGAVSSPQAADPSERGERALQAVERPPGATLQSLSVLFAQYPSIHRAYLVFCWPPEQPEARCYLVAVRMDRSDQERLVRESAQVMDDVPPGLNMDLMTFESDDDDFLQGIVEIAAPFYDRSWGERLISPLSGRLT